jgi:hypothetical protein
MEAIQTLTKLEVWHKDYNLGKKHNLDSLPTEKAVFGLFAIVNDEPINCRYIGEAENLQVAITGLFEKPEHTGLKKFMQGPWIQMLLYELMPASSSGERQKAAGEWVQKYKPNIDEEGEYPGYYDY